MLFLTNSSISQEPRMVKTRQPALTRPFDYQWYEKTSPNGEFKYGLCQCCSGPSCCIAIMTIIFCFIPLPGWSLIAQLNAEVADVVGKLKFLKNN
jgi:hypothetical protein